jgi:signal transduction histidine kinase
MVGCFYSFFGINFLKSRVYQFFFKLYKAGFLTIALAVYSVHSLSQDNAQIDSLKRLLEEQQGLAKFESLMALGIQYVPTNLSTSISYLRRAQQIALEYGDTAKIVRASRLVGEALRRADKFDSAITILNKTLPIAKRNKLRMDEKYLLNSLALSYTITADYDKALKNHFESLIIREADGNKSEISITLNNIGLVYFKLRDYQNAIRFYNRSLAVKTDAGDNYDMDRLLINIGLCHNQLHQFAEAEEFINEGLELCGDNCDDAKLIEGKFGLGMSSFGQGKYDEAKEFFESSLTIAKGENENKIFQAENLLFLGKIYIQTNDSAGARQALGEGERIANNSGFTEILIDIYREFSFLYNQSRNFEEAAAYQNKYINLKDSVYSEALIKNIAEVQTQYAQRENIATIASKEQALKQQRDLNIAVVIIAFLAGLLILVLQRSNRTIKRVNAQLSEAKEIIEDQNKLLEDKNKYLDREVEAKTIDLERANQSLKQVNDELDNFIYKTSHDIRGPLASLKGMCNVALMDVKDPMALDYLRKLDSTAERLNTILTRLLIINQINNSKLSVSKIDFDGIVRDVLMLEKKKGLPQKLKIRQRIEENKSINSDKELIRIVLENLIDNAIKFYNDSDRVDSFVEIHIVPAPLGHVKIRVVDNGIGISESNPGKLFRMFFRASERSETGGIGLYIVKTATAKLGGKVGLLTTPEGYTEFYVDFPPNPPAVEDGPDKPSIY